MGLGFQGCPLSIGLERFCKFGGGGAGLRVAGTGAIGVCSARACVYNSSSEEEGEQDSDDSGSNGFFRPMLSIFRSSDSGTMPAGQSEEFSQVLFANTQRKRYQAYPTMLLRLSLEVELESRLVKKKDHPVGINVTNVVSYPSVR